MTFIDIKNQGWETIAEDSNILVAQKNNFELSFDLEMKELNILKKISHSHNMFFKEPIYLGSCPDVGTFIYLCKLLKIS